VIGNCTKFSWARDLSWLPSAVEWSAVAFFYIRPRTGGLKSWCGAVGCIEERFMAWESGSVVNPKAPLI
jgi:hypothetical protein